MRTELDARLTADCPPNQPVPQSGPLPVGKVLERLAAVEEALIQCRAQLGEIRKLK